MFDNARHLRYRLGSATGPEKTLGKGRLKGRSFLFKEIGHAKRGRDVDR